VYLTVQADKSGTVSVEKLKNTIEVRGGCASTNAPQPTRCVCRWISHIHLKLCMQEFELTIDLSSVLKDLDKDRNGVVDYTEFSQLLGGH
jgi:hypothetical protein